MVMMYQCELHGVIAAHNTYGWIEERGAKIGAEVELGGKGGPLYRVVKVYQPGMDSKVLAEKQARDRNSLPSIAGEAA